MELYLDNSYCTLLNASEEIYNLLYDRLSFYQPGYRYSHLYKRKLWDGKTRLFNRKSNSFPSGLLPEVKKILQSKKTPFIINDVREKPSKNIKLRKLRNLPKLRSYQIEAVDKIKRHSRGIIHLPPGTGKTVIAIEAVYQKKLKTLLITPTVNITLQTYKRFKQIFGRQKVGIIYSDKKEYDKEVTIACAASLANNKRLKYPVPQAFYDQIDMLIIDEFHHSSADTYQELNKQQFENIYNRYGLTGTFFRDDGTDLKMHGVLSNVLYEMSIQDAINIKCLVKPEFFMHSVDIYNGDLKKFHDVYKEGIIENTERNDIIIKKSNEYRNQYTLILVKEIVHGEYLEKNIKGSKFITGKGSGSKNAQLIKDFENKKFNPLIATTVIGEGTDIPCIEVIINAQGLKAEGFLLQRIGRGMRLDTDKEKVIVIDFYDKDNGFLERHSKQRKKVYLKHLTNHVEIV